MIRKTQSQYFADRAKLEALNIGEQIEYYLCDYEHWKSVTILSKRYCGRKYTISVNYIKRIE